MLKKDAEVRTMCEGVRCSRCLDRMMVREIFMDRAGNPLRHGDWICDCGYRRPSKEESNGDQGSERSAVVPHPGVPGHAGEIRTPGRRRN